MLHPKKFEELQTILKDFKEESLKQFTTQNKTIIDQIFMEYILEVKQERKGKHQKIFHFQPNYDIIIQSINQRIQEKSFDLKDKEEYFIRKLIQNMESQYDGDLKEMLILFILYFNSNPGNTKVLLFLKDELSKHEDFNYDFLGDLLIGLNTGMNDHWISLYDFILPILANSLILELDYKESMVFEVFERLIEDEKEESKKIQKFQIIYKCIDQFEQDPFDEFFDFISNHTKLLNKEQILILFESFKNQFRSSNEIFFNFFKIIVERHPEEIENFSQK
jgi:hypothetical protein